MKVAMIKHSPTGKVFWFGVPKELECKVRPGRRVACDTSRGERYGTVVGANLNEMDVKDIMTASGATFPLRMITKVTQDVSMALISIPDFMGRTKPRDDKIAKRFLEYYHHGKFNTNIVVDENNVLLDGYSAYLVAKLLRIPYLPVIRTEEGYNG